jgi:hypothetical protein
MTILAGIFEFLLDLFKALPAAKDILTKYFPAKTPEQKVEEEQKAVADAISKERQSGRPEL